MCGIAGTLSFDPANFRVTDDLVTRMRDSIAHRGPDGAATWIADDGRIGLGFRRLAIIDLSETAMQPMPNEDGSIRIVFNGEIYNHAEIRPELERLGHVFRTDHSDTEVLVHGFEEWGIDVVHRLRGMFAFALWDERARELWLVRDRIGIKPLYWSLHHGRVSFASEIKALLQDPQQERAVDEEALYHYLSFLTTPAPQTLFRGIRKLAGGTWLRVSDERRRPARSATGTRGTRSTRSTASPKTRSPSASSTSCARRCSCARSATFRSASSSPAASTRRTNAALFSEGESRPIKTFSIGYEGEYSTYTNEFDYARKMAELVGAEHHERQLTQDDLIDFLPRDGAPAGRADRRPGLRPGLLRVEARARQRRRRRAGRRRRGRAVLGLSRRGRRCSGCSATTTIPSRAPLKRAGVALATAAGQGQRREIEFLRRGSLGQPVFWSGAEAFTEAQKQSLLSPRLRRELAGLTSWDAIEPIRAPLRGESAGSLRISTG